MIRSMLFVPGNNPAMLQNADVFGADAVILDLEDAVSPQEKDAARDLVKAYLDQLEPIKSQIYIRINGMDTIWFQDDLQAVVSDHIDGIMLPKAMVSDLKSLSDILAKIEKAKKMQKKIHIMPIVELAKSVLQIEEIAMQARVNGILLGAEDLSADMEIERTKIGTELAYPRAKIAFACRANKIEAIDTPFTDTKDSEGMKLDCLVAQNLGLTGKAAIHPNQLELIHEVFSPSEKRIEWAQRVVLAAKKAHDQGLGVFSLDGKMVDKPIIERAVKVLTKAEECGLLEHKK